MSGSAGAAGASDIPRNGWIDRWVPAAVRPYMRLARLDRPIGTWLLLFPCWWGTAMASAADSQLSDPWLLLLFAVGAVVMRGAGCAFNDWTDRDFDGRVARTANRPIPSGAISPNQALVFMAGLMGIGFLVLIQFNLPTILVGIASLPLVFTYPFMKRITYWPQLFLGLTFNWGMLVGWTAVTGELSWAAIVLYVAGIVWTLGYDTIYAHQDKEDDALIGVKSSALRLGENTRPWLVVFYGVTLVFLAVSGTVAGGPLADPARAWPFWLALVAVAGQMAWQVATLRIDDPADCLSKFRSNRWIGWIIIAGISASSLLPAG